MLPTPPNRTEIPPPGMLPSVAVPGVGSQDSDYPDCAMLAGLSWNAAWLHDIWFFICCTLPTSQSSQNLTAAHLFSLPPPPKSPSPSSTVRMQSLNPNPDNGKSARWSLFPVPHPHPPSSKRMSAILQPQTPSFK